MMEASKEATRARLEELLARVQRNRRSSGEIEERPAAARPAAAPPVEEPEEEVEEILELTDEEIAGDEEVPMIPEEFEAGAEEAAPAPAEAVPEPSGSMELPPERPAPAEGREVKPTVQMPVLPEPGLEPEAPTPGPEVEPAAPSPAPPAVEETQAAQLHAEAPPAEVEAEAPEPERAQVAYEGTPPPATARPARFEGEVATRKAPTIGEILHAALHVGEDR
jgi:hypothetical protein